MNQGVHCRNAGRHPIAFAFTPTEGLLHVQVRVPAAHVDVLDALAERAFAGMKA